MRVRKELTNSGDGEYLNRAVLGSIALFKKTQQEKASVAKFRTQKTLTRTLTLKAPDFFSTGGGLSNTKNKSGNSTQDLNQIRVSTTSLGSPPEPKLESKTEASPKRLIRVIRRHRA